jgi:CRISPR-associated protein Csb1
MNRQYFDVPLRVAIGSRFQPTGFPDLGAAVFERPVVVDGVVTTESCLLVESPQSVANHLEAQLWDLSEQRPIGVIDRVPFVEVVDLGGAPITSSRVEAHRLASAFIKDSTLDDQPTVDVLRDRLGLRDDAPLSALAIAQAVFELDPLCLVHGVFFADNRWPGQPKIARAVTGFVEASGVAQVEYGGVKRDAVRHSLDDSAGGTAEGYGSVPYARTEWTAREIVASFSIDHRQLRSYGLDADAVELLTAIILYEIRCFLDDGLRLRTACEFEVMGEVADRNGVPLGSFDELERRLAAAVETVVPRVEHPGARQVVWNGGTSRRQKGRRMAATPVEDGEG